MTRIQTALFQEVLHNQDAALHGGRVRLLISLRALEQKPGGGRFLLAVGPGDFRLTCDVLACLPGRVGSTISSLTVRF